MKEDDLQKLVVQYLKQYCTAWIVIHIPNQAIGKAGALRNNKAIYSKQMQRIGYVKGAPDLVLFNPLADRKFIFLELKSKTGRLSESQKEFRRYCCEKWGEEFASQYYYTVRSLDEVKAIIDGF